MDTDSPVIVIAHEPTPPVDALAAVWERAVRATHAFVTEDEIALYAPQVRDMLAAINPLVLRVDGTPLGFLAQSGTHIEALFIDPSLFRRGLGTRLLRQALAESARTVDVNEENPPALAFYQANGFTVAARDPCDPAGRSHPILHLALSKQ